MIKCVIFDLDDTLYPEWSYIKQGFLAVSERLYKDFNLQTRYSSHDIYEVLKDIYTNHTRVKIFNHLHRFIPEIEINESYIVDELVPTFRFSNKTLECYPDVKPTLDTLTGKVKIGMVTNGNAQVQNSKIDLLKIRKYFDRIEISGDYSEDKAKPSTFMLLKILDIFQVKPHDVIYVGNDPATDRCSMDIGCNFLRIIRKNSIKSDHSHTKDKYHSISSISKLHHYIDNYQTMFNLFSRK